MAETFEIFQSSLSAEQMEAAKLNQVPRINQTSLNWEIWDVVNMRWNDTGVSSVGLSILRQEYGVSASPSTQPTEWQDTLPVVSQGQVLWTRIAYSDGSYGYTYSIQGVNGEDGDDGVTISSVQYGQSTSASTEPTTWQSTMPNVPQGQYLWTRINYSDGTVSKTYSRQGVDGSGSGDMTKSTYDPDNEVADAGGIVEYVEANGGKVATVSVNGGTPIQPDVNKNINIPIPAPTVATYFTVTVGTTWTKDATANWYTQTITNTQTANILATDKPDVDIDLSSLTVSEGVEAALTAWGNIFRVVTADGSVTVYSAQATETAIIITLRCIR